MGIGPTGQWGKPLPQRPWQMRYAGYMTQATQPIHNRIALIFDFDETLAPDTFSALLEQCQIDPDWFHAEKVQPLLDDGWDKKLARFSQLAKMAREQDDLTLTADTFAEVGRQLPLYPEVEQMFDRLRDAIHAIDDEIEVEFYLLTAGMLEIPRATAVADQFRTLWGGELHFDSDGNLAGVKRTVSYPDKIRYILKLCKGLDIDHPRITQDVYREIPHEAWHVPLSQIVYVGDGDSDMPAFAYLKEHSGIAIGVFQAESADEWEGHSDMHDGRRVQNLARSDYREGSELMQSLRLAVESIAKQVALRQLSGEK